MIEGTWLVVRVSVVAGTTCYSSKWNTGDRNSGVDY